MNLYLTDEEYKLIVDGLEQLKSKDFGGKVLKMMLGSMLERKITDPEDKRKWELQKEKEELEEKREEQEKELLKTKIDILKGKILMVQQQAQLGDSK